MSHTPSPDGPASAPAAAPEPLAAILAEFRAFALRAADEDKMISPESVLLLADKVEAAVERERNAHINDIHDAIYKATGIPGNAAALRVALENARSKFIHIKKCADEGEVSRKKLTILCEFVSQEIAAALAAPARNCDRFATELDARLAWKREAHCKGDYRYWLFATAEGGDHA